MRHLGLCNTSFLRVYPRCWVTSVYVSLQSELCGVPPAFPVWRHAPSPLSFSKKFLPDISKYTLERGNSFAWAGEKAQSLEARLQWKVNMYLKPFTGSVWHDSTYLKKIPKSKYLLGPNVGVRSWIVSFSSLSSSPRVLWLVHPSVLTPFSPEQVCTWYLAQMLLSGQPYLLSTWRTTDTHTPATNLSVCFRNTCDKHPISWLIFYDRGEQGLSCRYKPPTGD